MIPRFVERQQELETLHISMQNVLNSKGSIVLIAGEAGIGKSELINEFRESIDPITDKKLLIAQTTCSKLGGPVDPFLPFLDLYDNIFIDKDKEQVRGEISGILSDIAPEIASFILVVGGQISAAISISKNLMKRWGIMREKEHLLERKDTSQERFYSEYTKALQGESSVYAKIRKWATLL